jgi:hypothetical protein
MPRQEELLNGLSQDERAELLRLLRKVTGAGASDPTPQGRPPQKG